jgi:hypothetical protein
MRTIQDESPLFIAPRLNGAWNAPYSLQPYCISRLLDDGILDIADPSDLYPHPIPYLQIAARCHFNPHTAACPGGDNIPRLQGKHGGEDRHLIEAIEDHVTGIGRLPDLAVYQGTQIQGVRIAVNLIGRDDPGTDRPVGIKRLTERQGRRPRLPIPDRDIIDDQIPRDHLMSALFGHMPAMAADDKAELTLVIELVGDTWPVDGVIGTVDAGRLFIEKGRELRSLAPGFLNVIGIVQADGEKLGGPLYRGLKVYLRQG